MFSRFEKRTKRDLDGGDRANVTCRTIGAGVRKLPGQGNGDSRDRVLHQTNVKYDISKRRQARIHAPERADRTFVFHTT